MAVRTLPHTLSVPKRCSDSALWLTAEILQGMLGHLRLPLVSVSLFPCSLLLLQRFTAFYRARSGSEQCGDSPVRGDSPVGGDSASSSHSTLMSPSCQLPSVQGRRPCAKDGRLGTKACSAGVRTMVASSLLTSTTTSTEQEFRRDLATLDADIARLHIQFKVAQQLT